MSANKILIYAGLISLFLGVGLGVAKTQNATQHFHKTYFVHETDFFDTAFARAKPIEEAIQPIKGVLVNHHLLGGDLIASIFLALSSDRRRTVIILSPNHFSAGQGKFITGTWPWHTPYGNILIDQALIGRLHAAKLVTIEDGAMEGEHGISNLLAFMKVALPKARLVPIMLSPNLTPAEVESWTSKLHSLIKNNLVVASLDMSHYLVEAEAFKQDQSTIACIRAVDQVAAWHQKVDSPATLSAWLALMKLRSAEFTFVDRSSSTILGGVAPKDNTSYITGFFN